MTEQKPAISPEAIAQIVNEGIPHCKALGVYVVGLADGIASLGLKWRPDLVGDPATGVLAGGVVTALLDTCAGMAVWAKVDRPMQIATLDLRIDYLRPAATGKDLVARAECFRITRHVAFVRGTCFDPDEPERTVAHCTGAFMLDTAGPQPRKP